MNDKINNPMWWTQSFTDNTNGVANSITTAHNGYLNNSYYQTSSSPLYYSTVSGHLLSSSEKDDIMEDIISFCKDFCPLCQERICDEDMKKICPLGKRIRLEGRE